MKHLTPQQKKFLKIAGVVLLILVCLLSLVSFIRSFKTLYRAGELQPEYIQDREERRSGDSGTSVQQTHRVVTTIDTIRPWMTFNYLTVVFKLPPLYLKDTLAITDPRYPNIRIDRYIKQYTLDPNLFMQSVQQAIRSYSATGK